MEIWKDVVGYEGLYQVSSFGKVRSLDRVNARGWNIKGKLLTVYLRKDGYLGVWLSKDRINKNFLVHRLLAEAFIPNPDRLPCVNHKDEIRSHCFLENLEWITVKGNNNYGTRNKRMASSHMADPVFLTKLDDLHRSNQKRVRCVETGKVYDSAKEAGHEVHGRVSAAARDNRKTAGGFHWEYV